MQAPQHCRKEYVLSTCVSNALYHCTPPNSPFLLLDVPFVIKRRNSFVEHLFFKYGQLQKLKEPFETLCVALVD